MKTCTVCGIYKPLDAYALDKRDGRLQARCKTCAAQYSREYVLANRESVRARNAAWREVNRDEVLAREAKKRAVNRVEILAARRARYAENPRRYAAQHSAWKKANRAACTAAENLRHALKKTAEAEFIDRDVIFERDKGLCYLCAKPIDRSKPRYHADSFVVDHIKPLASGGAHTYENTACAHWSCNAKKHDNPWWETAEIMK